MRDSGARKPEPGGGARWVGGIAVGEPVAWRKACHDLWLEFSDRLLLLASAVVRDPSAAEDVLQNVFVRLLRSEGSFDIACASTYLFRAVRNEALNARRSRDRGRSLERTLALFELPAEDASQAVQEREFQDQVAHHLRALGREFREAIVLKIWSGLTAGEAAKVLQINPKLFEYRYYQGLAQLRERMGVDAG